MLSLGWVALRAAVKTVAFIAAVLLVCGADAIDTPCDGGHRCKNGATCIKVSRGGIEQNVCICKPQYTGWDCSVELDYCKTHCRSYRKNVNCQQALCNQGNCISRTEYPFYSCDCGAFYTGANCEVEYNPCSQPATNPCDHGVCTFVRGTNQVMCQCKPGWAPNPNQQVMKLSWNGADIFVAPPCSGKTRRGNPCMLCRAEAKAMWHFVFLLSLGILLWRLVSGVYVSIAYRNANTTQ
ncbi:membrane protein, putative [Babesia bigemina]|uniref:Membrane protein, putative n=1 Tax=Babesia bigemina TaxID=5866 RepID=A0A061DA70_BABBI|nr:membrane protein, putative [Babesia bigemina]CDR94640.1 membrane protein, putative [Babesia bigemina]|eukprot:XP_012766826.1 membrane protein, putative [Babesia bigemina]